MCNEFRPCFYQISINFNSYSKEISNCDRQLLGISGVVSLILYRLVVHQLCIDKWQKQSIFHVFDLVFIKSQSILIVIQRKLVIVIDN